MLIPLHVYLICTRTFSSEEVAIVRYDAKLGQEDRSGRRAERFGLSEEDIHIPVSFAFHTQLRRIILSSNFSQLLLSHVKMKIRSGGGPTR